MSTAANASPALLTAEEFAERPDPGHPEELVRGRIVPMPMTKPRHGEICGRTDRVLGGFVDEHDLGRVLTNDSGVITERGPDTVRGADVAYYSFARVPKDPLPDRYLDVAPELVVEVLSPTDRWPKVMVKVGEYLAAGVLVVLVLDDERRAAHVFTAEGANRILASAEELTLPELFGDAFRARVGRFFD